MLRHFTHGLTYRDPDRVVVLAQGSPYFGIRMGFRDRETAVFRARSHSLEGLATYMWTNTVFQSPRGHREVIAAEVGPQFFNVLGVGPSRGQGLDGPETFLASYDFWKTELRANPAAIGQSYEIGGRPMRLTGVMPRSFSFLSTPIAVWIAVGPEPAVPASRWWLALRGAIGRLRPGVSQADAEKELREILVSVSLARRNFIVRATPIGDLVYRPVWSYGFDLLLSTSLILLWTGFNVFRDRRRGASWRMVSALLGLLRAEDHAPADRAVPVSIRIRRRSPTRLHRRRSPPRHRSLERLVLLLRHRRDSHLGLARSTRPLPRLPTAHAPAPAHRSTRPSPPR